MTTQERLATLLTALEDALMIADYMWAGTDFPYHDEKKRINELRQYAKSLREELNKQAIDAAQAEKEGRL